MPWGFVISWRPEQPSVSRRQSPISHLHSPALFTHAILEHSITIRNSLEWDRRRCSYFEEAEQFHCAFLWIIVILWESHKDNEIFAKSCSGEEILRTEPDSPNTVSKVFCLTNSYPAPLAAARHTQKFSKQNVLMWGKTKFQLVRVLWGKSAEPIKTLKVQLLSSQEVFYEGGLVGPALQFAIALMPDQGQISPGNVQSCA